MLMLNNALFRRKITLSFAQCSVEIESQKKTQMQLALYVLLKKSRHSHFKIKLFLCEILTLWTYFWKKREKLTVISNPVLLFR